MTKGRATGPFFVSLLAYKDAVAEWRGVLQLVSFRNIPRRLFFESVILYKLLPERADSIS